MRNIAVFTLGIMIYMVGNAPFALDCQDDPLESFRSFTESDIEFPQ